MRYKYLNAAMRVIAVLLVLATALSFVSCGKKDSLTKTLVKNVYKYDFVDLPGNIESVNNIIYHDSAYYILCYETDENKNWATCIKQMDAEGNATSVNVENAYENGYIDNMCVDSNGDLWFSESSYEYDEESQTSTQKCTIHKFSPDTNESVLFDISNEKIIIDNGYTPSSLCSDQNGGIYFIIGNAIYHISGDGEMTSKESSYTYINELECTVSGSIYAFVYDDVARKQLAKTLDPQTLELGSDVAIPETALNYIYSFITGPGYDFYYADSTGLMAFNIGDTEVKELCNWLNSDTPSTNFGNISIIDDSNFCSVYYDYSDDYTQKLINFTKVPDTEIKEKYVITVAVDYLNYAVREKIVEFNRTNEEYRVSVNDYSKYNVEGNWNGGTIRLNNDIVSGNVPDILMISSNLPYDSYVSKGLFADLYQYIDADPEIKREDYLENILALTETDGKLNSIITNFYIRTVAAKESTVNGADGLNMDEFNAILAANPDALAFYDVTRDALLEFCSTVAIGQFIDRETGKCSFDSPDFVKILEFAKTLGSESVYDNIDWNEVDENFWNDIDTAILDGRVLFSMQYISSFFGYWQTSAGEFGGDFALVGFPCESRNGSAIGINQELAISSKTNFGDACWQFLRTFLLDDYQDEIYSFPIKLSSLDKLAEAAMTPDEYDKYPVEDSVEVVEDIDVKEVIEATAGAAPAVAETEETPADTETEYEYHNYYYIGGQQIDIGWPTQEDIDSVIDFIKKVDQVERIDEKINTIMKEEASVYFAGQKSAEETAKIIQNRISTYVAEGR